MSTTESSPSIKTPEDYWRESAAELVAVPCEAGYETYRARYLHYALTVYAVETASGNSGDIVADDMNRRFRNGVIDASSNGWENPCNLEPRSKESWLYLVKRHAFSSLKFVHIRRTPNPQTMSELLRLIDTGEIIFAERPERPKRPERPERPERPKRP